MALALRSISKLNLVLKGASVTSVRFYSDPEKEGMNTLKQRYLFLQGFHKYGLLRDDIRHEFDPDVAEAVKRLPKKMKMERDYRCIRACQASIQNTILPEELWTKPTDNHFYLEDLVQEAKREREEREDWEKTH